MKKTYKASLITCRAKSLIPNNREFSATIQKKAITTTVVTTATVTISL